MLPNIRLKLISFVFFLCLLISGGVFWQFISFLNEIKEEQTLLAAQRDIHAVGQEMNEHLNLLEGKLLKYIQKNESSLAQEKNLSLPDEFSSIWLLEVQGDNTLLRWHKGEKDRLSFEKWFKNFSVVDILINIVTLSEFEEELAIIKPLKISQNLIAVGIVSNEKWELFLNKLNVENQVYVLNRLGQEVSFKNKVNSVHEAWVDLILNSVEMPLGQVIPLPKIYQEAGVEKTYVQQNIRNGLYIFWQSEANKVLIWEGLFFWEMLISLIGLTFICLLLAYFLGHKWQKYCGEIVSKDEAVGKEKGRGISEEVPLEVFDSVDESEIRMLALIQISKKIIENISPPVTSIIGQTKLIQSKEGKKCEDHFSSLEESAREVREILDRLSLFSGLEEVEKKPVDLKLLIPAVLRFFELKIQDLNIELKIENSADVCIKGHSELLQLVLTEVVNNALEAMHRTLSPSLKIQVSEVEGGVKLIIQDSGSGIANEKLGLIREPFVTDASDRHMGLGLSVVSGILMSLGASLKIESDLGQGTVVEMFFEVIEGRDTFVYNEPV